MSLGLFILLLIIGIGTSIITSLAIDVALINMSISESMCNELNKEV